MANAKFIEQKAAKVAEIQAKIEKAKSIVFFDYRSITVAEDTELRRSMRKENVEYVVLKNNMAASSPGPPCGLLPELILEGRYAK